MCQKTILAAWAAWACFSGCGHLSDILLPVQMQVISMSPEITTPERLQWVATLEISNPNMLGLTAKSLDLVLAINGQFACRTTLENLPVLVSGTSRQIRVPLAFPASRLPSPPSSRHIRMSLQGRLRLASGYGLTAEAERSLEMPGLIFPRITYQIDPSPDPLMAKTAVLSLTNPNDDPWHLRRVDLIWYREGKIMRSDPLSRTETLAAQETRTVVLLLRPAADEPEAVSAAGGMGEAEFETVWGIVRVPFTGP